MVHSGIERTVHMIDQLNATIHQAELVSNLLTLAIILLLVSAVWHAIVREKREKQSPAKEEPRQ